LLGDKSQRHQIAIEVTTSVKPGPSPGYFTYTYTVRSEKTSRSDVETFGLAPAPEPDSTVSPNQWWAFFGFDARDDAIVWTVVDTLTSAPPAWDSTNTWPSPYGIQPGQTKVFRLVSKYPPMRTEYFSQGFAGIPDADAYDDEHFPTLFNMGVKGEAYCPDDSLALEDNIRQHRKGHPAGRSYSHRLNK